MSVVARGRRAAERQMRDEFTAYTYAWTVVDGLDEQTWVQQDVTFGKFPNKLTAGDATNTRTVAIGGVERPLIEGGLHLPFADSPQVGWEYVLTWPGPETHPSLLGKRVRVVEIHPASQMTAWRLDIVEVDA